MVHFSDDGGLWKRVWNLEFLTEKIQEAILKVDKWLNKWGAVWGGSGFQSIRQKNMLFKRTKVRREVKLK